MTFEGSVREVAGQPVDGIFGGGVVGAAQPGADRAVEMGGEVGSEWLDAFDGIADAGADGLAGAFGGIVGPGSGLAAEASGSTDLGEDLLARC